MIPLFLLFMMACEIHSPTKSGYESVNNEELDETFGFRHASSPNESEVPPDTLFIYSSEILFSITDTLLNDLLAGNSKLTKDSIFVVTNKHGEIPDTVYLYTYDKSSCVVYKSEVNQMSFLQNSTLTIKDIKLPYISIGTSTEAIEKILKGINGSYHGEKTIVIREDDYEVIDELVIDIDNNKVCRITYSPQTLFSLNYTPHRELIIKSWKVKK